MSAARASKATLERLRRERDGEEADVVAMPLAGPGQRLALVGEPDPARVTVISDVLGESITHDRRKMEAILFSQSEVGARSLDVFRSCVEIGEAIGNLKRTLTSDEYGRLVASAPLIWGRHLSRGTVNQLVAVAASVRNRRLDTEKLPKSISIVYQFSTLSDQELGRAQEVGIYHSGVTRREVIRWKEDLRRAEAVEDTAGVASTVASRKALRRGRERLRTERRRLVARVTEIDAEIEKIEGELGE